MAGSVKFIKDKNYLKEMAEYLDARGCTIDDLPGVPYCETTQNLFVKTEGKHESYSLKGWAYKIKGPTGEYYDNDFLLRVCNWPYDQQLYQFERAIKDFVVFKGKPLKFIDKGTSRVHWESTFLECCAAPAVMIHEKFTCASLSVRHCGIPSIALSGCGNWQKDGVMKPEIKKLIEGLKLRATLYVCFDGDIKTNVNIMHEARKLRGWVENLRPDIELKFPIVPEGFGGWDDWVAAHDRDTIAVDWVMILNEAGVDVTSCLPAPLLIETYGLVHKVDKDGALKIAHSTSNYAKIFSGHPKWAEYIMNIDMMCYQISDPSRPLEFSEVATRLEMWLTDHVFLGSESEKVRSACCQKAVEEVMGRGDRRASLPHHVLRSWGPVAEDEARRAATELVTNGIRVVGPMSLENTAETILRVMRDIVGMWSFDDQFNPQWMLALVGPSGSGKSDFAKSLLGSLSDVGFRAAHGRLHYTGDKAKPEEMARVLSSTLLAVMDEYNPPSPEAKKIEDQLLGLTSERTMTYRRMRENNAKPHPRCASLLMTTTDKNRQFLRSGKGEGAERRAIVLEVVGHKDYYGTQSSDRSVIKECGRLLLRWGLAAYEAGWGGPANEFAAREGVCQYLEDDETLSNIAKYWAAGDDLGGKLSDFGKNMYREHTEDVRFSPTQFDGLLMPEGKMTRVEKTSIRNLIVEMGAEVLKKGARVNVVSAMKGGPRGETTADKAYSVKDWDAFCSALRAKLGV